MRAGIPPPAPIAAGFCPSPAFPTRIPMKASMLAKLDQLAERLDEVNALLAREDATANIDQYRKLSREHAELSPVTEQYGLYRQAQDDLATAQALLDDPEMKDFAADEIASARERLETLEGSLQKLLLPKDPNDDRNLILEIRAARGEESALFAGDLLRMYTRFAERQRWQVEIMSESESDLGGYKEVIVRIAGDAAFSRLKFESGGHRVQRVPATEAQGRIHTSACTVAVMPEADEVGEVEINPPTCASTRSGRRAPAASTSTRPTRPSVSRTSRLASWWNARTTAASTATRTRP